MNKKAITLIAGSALLALGVPSVVFAQTGGAASGPFADVPADHWAYQSVDTLQKAGIVIGYPDGTYGGKRAMTRYEFAVAIARLLPLIGQNNNYATKDDLAALRADEEKSIQSNADAIDALSKLVDEFTPELQKLGQDVSAIKDRLDALEERVAAVEEEQRRVKFNGALNVIAEGESLTKGSAFLDENGNYTTSSTGIDKHVLQTTDVYQDFLLGITGRVSDTATANVKIDFGNYLSALGNTESPGNAAGGLNTQTSLGGLSAANQSTTVWEANLKAPVSLGPLGGADLVAGRFGNQWTKYTLREVDADVYTSLYQTDSGNITTDGAKVDLNLGPAKVNAWAGQFKAIPFAQPWGGIGVGTTTSAFLPGGLLAPTHGTPLQQGAGARATFGDPDYGVLGVDVEQFGFNSPLTAGKNTANVLSVYGADYNGDIPFIGHTGLKIDASITDAPEGTSSTGFNNAANNWSFASTDDQLGINLGSLELKGGYQYVGPNFSAPGYWGRAGSWTNPTNVEGGVGSAKYTISSNLTINGDIEDYKPAASKYTDSPLQGGDKLNRYQVGLGYGLTSSYAVDLGYEEDQWTISQLHANELSTTGVAGKPTQSFLTFGIGHTFNQNASFKLLYQVVQYKDKNTGFLNGNPGDDTTGNVAVGQFQLKF